MWPQITYLFLSVLGFGIALAKHGEPKDGKHDAIATLFGTAIILWILYKGGFFNGL